jgi:uncharacterized membrane protein
MAATFESVKQPSTRPLDFRPAAGVRQLSQTFIWSLRLLCCIALAVTGYLAVTALREGDVAGCTGGAVWDCNVALHSQWSKVLGIPVSVPAFVLYVVVLGSLSFCRPGAPKWRQRVGWEIATVAGISAGMAAVWFISLQIFALKHLCVYCIAAHLCGLLLCLAILWKRPIGGRTTAMLSGVGAFGLGMLIVAQVFATPPQTYKVEHYPAAVTASNADSEKSPSASSHASSKPQDKNGAAKSDSSPVFEPPAGVPDDPAEK